MSEPEHQRRANELSRLWQSQVLPVEDEDVTAQRRAQLTPSIASAIGRAAAGRRRGLRLRKVIAALSIAAAACGVFGVGRFLVQRSHSSPVASTVSSAVRALSGVVTLMNGAGPAAVFQASPLEIGDALSTGPDGRAELKLTDLVLAEVEGSSELSMVTPTASTHRLRLDRGRIRARVNDRPSTTPKLVVETPNADVIVTGTVFQVEVTPGKSPAESVTTVFVTKGRVVVRHDGKDVAAVTAGETWSSAPIAAAAREPEPKDARAIAVRSHGPVTVRPNGASPRAAHLGTLAEENALFQNAVDARNEGDDRTEADHLGSLLSRYPASPLAGEARVERMRALQRTGQAFEAAREARRYLAEYPDGFARDEARRLVMQGGVTPRPAP